MYCLALKPSGRGVTLFESESKQKNASLFKHTKSPNISHAQWPSVTMPALVNVVFLWKNCLHFACPSIETAVLSIVSTQTYMYTCTAFIYPPRFLPLQCSNPVHGDPAVIYVCSSNQEDLISGIFLLGISHLLLRKTWIGLMDWTGGLDWVPPKLPRLGGWKTATD